MNRTELRAGLLSICEDVSQVLYDKHGFSNDTGTGPMPVEMWGDQDGTTVPIVLVKDTGRHPSRANGNTTYDGEAYDPDGNVDGEAHRFSYTGTPEIVIRHDGVQMDASRIGQAFHNRFARFQSNPDWFKNELPDQYYEVGEEPVSQFKTELGEKEIGHNVGNDVHQPTVFLEVEYNDVLIDPDPEAMDGIYTDLDADDDGSTDASYHVHDGGIDEI